MPSRDGSPPARAGAKRAGWAGRAVRPEVPAGGKAGGLPTADMETLRGFPCLPAMVRRQRGRARSARGGQGGQSVPKSPQGAKPAGFARD